MTGCAWSDSIGSWLCTEGTVLVRSVMGCRRERPVYAVEVCSEELP